MSADLARAGEPMTDRELWATLAALRADERVSVVVTDGPDRLGRTIVQVSGTDDPLGVLDILARSASSRFTLHGIHAGELVSVTGTRDAGAVTVRDLLWSVVGLGAVVAVWSLWVADLVERMQAFGVMR